MLEKFNNLTDKQKSYVAVAVFAVLVLTFYGNTLGNGFVFDDKSQIENNPYIQSVEYLPKVITGCAWEASLANGCKGTGIHYRPVQALSWFIGWHISPGPWPFHLMNLVYFFITAVVVFLFVKLLTKNFFLAFLTGLFFLIHPVNNEVANFVVLPPDFGLAIFSMAAGIFYFHYRTKGNSGDLKLVYLFYFLAMLSKEPAFIIVPLSLLALDLIIFKLPIRTFFQWSPELKRYLFLLIPAAVYFGMRFLVLGLNGTFLISASSAGGASFVERIYVFFTLFIEYMGEIVYPYPLQFFHTFVVSDALVSLPFILSFAGVALYVGAVYFAIKKGERILAFFLSWIVIFFFPLLIFFDMAEMRVFFDRFFFASSIGFVFGVSYLLNYVWQDKSSLPFISYSRAHRVIAKVDIHTRRMVVVALVGIMIVSSWAIIFPRNKDWKNFETMYTITLQQTPDAHIIRRDLANEYFQQGDLEKSRVEFEYLIENAQDWKDITMAYKGMGDYWRIQGDEEQTLSYYLQAAQTAGFSPRDWVVYNDIGVIYMQREEYLTGFSYLCQAMQLFPTQQVQQSIDASLTAIDETYIQTDTLTATILDQFEPAPVVNIVSVGNRCDDDTCQWGFSINPNSFDVIPPFLITASAPHAWRANTTAPVEITNTGFDQQNNVIILETDVEYEDTEVSFTFPTCARTYYEVSTE